MSSVGKIRILIVDDHQVVRQAFRSMLQEQFEICAEAGDGTEALQMITKHLPDVVLLDIAMPGLGGIEVASRVARKLPKCRVLMLSHLDDEESVFAALEEGRAGGYVLKTDGKEELIAAIRAVHAGKRYLSPEITPMVLSRLSAGPAARERDKLTRREREILKLLAEGATSKAIANKLNLSPKTVDVHRNNIKQKLNVPTTAAMIRYAIKHKIAAI